MKKYSVLLAIVALVLASLACQTIMGGGDNDFTPPDVDSGEDGIATTPPESNDQDFSFGDESEYPMPGDASNVISVGGVVNFQTDLSLEEAMKFYQDEFGKLGYTERGLLTVTSDTTFSMVYDGHESGQAITIQGVDLGDGTVNVSISLQDIP